jgi:NhaP-type Na+/H+ or K+/H+ antiporter
VPTLRRLTLLIALATVGWVVAVATGLDAVGHDGYLLAVSVLLAIGLYSSTYGIEVSRIRADARLIVLAVTVGVLLKAALIALVMFAVFRDPAYVVLAVVVAQIDPLSVAAMQRHSRMSPRARSILAAWASFDDPITTLLTIYLTAVTLNLLSGTAPAHDASTGTGLVDLAAGLTANLLFAAGAFLLWRLLRSGTGIVDRQPPKRRQLLRRVGHVGAIALLAALLGIAVGWFLMLAVALFGLFFRPSIAGPLDRLTQAAFLSATVALGLLLPDGIDPVGGAVLGLAAYAAQIVAGLLVGWRLPIADRIQLALGQQNGITAIILALLLEPDLPGTVATVAPAILVINLLHATANAIHDRHADRRGSGPGDTAGRLRRLTVPRRRRKPSESSV